MKKINLAISILLILAFTSCKKGKNDPFLSLRSRKARVVGEWIVNRKSSELKIETKDSNGGNQTTDENTINYSNGKEVNVNTSINSLGTKSKTTEITYTEEYTFNKNYTFARNIQYSDGTYSNTTGTWGFLNKSKEFKNKEQIFFSYDNIDKNNGSTVKLVSTGMYLMGTFEINMLKNKAMNLEVNKSQNSIQNNSVIDRSEVTSIELIAK